jgi:hypothetical protein
MRLTAAALALLLAADTPRLWGDLTGEGAINALDAQIILFHAIGGSVPVDTLPGDVDADGQVQPRDALIVLSFAVGMDVSRFRVGQAMPAIARGPRRP